MPRFVMTRQGFQDLQEKLRALRDERLPTLEKRLGAARELGDLSENSEFHAAREEIWLVERQIKDLKDQLQEAEVVDNRGKNLDAVYLGAQVQVLDLDTKEPATFLIVGHGEGDPSRNRISISSPMGVGFLGKKKDEEFDVRVPAGVRRFRILGYAYP